MQRLETEGQNLAAKLKDEAFMAADERTELQRRLVELQADFNLKGQALQEDQRRRFNEEQKKVLNNEGSGRHRGQYIAKAQGYDLVLNGQSVVFGAEKLDISSVQQVSKSK